MRQLKQWSRDFFGREKLLPRLLVLTLLKESYLLAKNSYGFLVHPFLTLKRISRDRSQMAIFASLWFGAWFGVLLIFAALWLIMKFLPPLAIFAKWVIWAVGIAAIFLLLFTFYLGYWWAFWQKKERAYQRRND